jgi:hypothetical protein
MSDKFKQVTGLIKELLSLNKAEIASMAPNAEEVAGRKSKRKKIRQELVQALSVRDT